MSRLTEKKGNGLYRLKPGQEIYGEENGIRLVQIVGQYEDADDELGIDWVTLSKALKNGICIRRNYANGGYKIKHVCGIMVNGFGRITYYDEEYQAERCVKISEYGKTWALTKEELE